MAAFVLCSCILLFGMAQVSALRRKRSDRTLLAGAAAYPPVPPTSDCYIALSSPEGAPEGGGSCQYWTEISEGCCDAVKDVVKRDPRDPGNFSEPIAMCHSCSEERNPRIQTMRGRLCQPTWEWSQQGAQLQVFDSAKKSHFTEEDCVDPARSLCSIGSEMVPFMLSDKTIFTGVSSACCPAFKNILPYEDPRLGWWREPPTDVIEQFCETCPSGNPFMMTIREKRCDP